MTSRATTGARAAWSPAEGTITHEGEGSVKVLVTVGPESAAFYRDEPEQELFDSVSFPVTVEDANDDGTGFDLSSTTSPAMARATSS